MIDTTPPPTPAIRFSVSAPSPSPQLRVRLASAGPALWRVMDPTGRIIGHVTRVEHTLGERWGARRYHDRVGGFRAVGEFWSIDDAVAALRSS